MRGVRWRCQPHPQGLCLVGTDLGKFGIDGRIDTADEEGGDGWIFERSLPAACAASSPVSHASMTAL